MFTIATAVAATLLLNGGQQPAGPACEPPPDGSSQEISDCYEEACKSYRASFNACSSQPCIAAAQAQYALDLGECWEGYFQRVSHGSWVTLWYAGDEFGVSYDNNIPVGAHAFLF